MSKRKEAHGDEESDEDHTPELVDVNFDYYDVKAANDYHAIQRLFIQLFGPDAEQIQTGPLTELVATVAEESGVGSTIKTEEDEGSDPYAVLTVISCRDHPGLRPVLDYLVSKTRSDAAFHRTLSKLLDDQRECHVGLVLSERLINMPVQVMAPMYRMLSEEMDEQGSAYAFTHLLFVSRVYRLTAEEEEAMRAVQRNSKRPRPTSERTRGIYAFHPEDEEILEYATHAVTYDLTETVGGRVMLVPGTSWSGLVSKLESTYTCQ